MTHPAIKKPRPTTSPFPGTVSLVAPLLLMVGCDAGRTENTHPQATTTARATLNQEENNRVENSSNPTAGKEEHPLPHILVFTKTKKYRHKNIPDGVHALREMGRGRFVVEQTEDSGVFTKENLARFSAVVFFSTTGDILDGEQQEAFEQYIHSGGGFVGIHAAADTEYEWPWYGRLVGAWFQDHTKVILATVHREDKTHISTVDFPDAWRREDEWYRFQTNPRKRTSVLLNVNDHDLGEFTMNGDHPISWMHEFEGGRAWYTGMGHTKESFEEKDFRNHIVGGIMWAMGRRHQSDSP